MSERSEQIKTSTWSAAKHIGRVGALAVALGIGTARRHATRVTVSIGVAALVVTAAAPVSTTVRLSADSTALLVCGLTCHTFNDTHVEDIKNQFIAPTHPGQDIDYVPVTTPSEVWPLTGVLRALEALGFADSGCPSPAGDCRPDYWPDEPLWKLSGLFDLTYDQSVKAGVADLEAAMAAAGNDHLVIYGDDQGANVATVMKRKLAGQYPTGTAAPDIDFVLTGDSNVPNGGLHARFPGLYVPIGWTFDGPEPTNTQFHTDVIIRQYDGIADFPLYPLNPFATANALLGTLYVHPFLFGVSLQPDQAAPPPIVSQYGDTTYHFFETKDLPLFGPLRTLGVPESLIDVVEPFFRVLVELGYDRSISPGEPTPARLIPPLDPAKLITDLGNAIGQGANNAAALLGATAPLSRPAPVTLAAPADQAADTDNSPKLRSTQTAPPTDLPTQTEQVDATDHTTTNGQASANTAPTANNTKTTQTDEKSPGPTAGGAPAPSDLAPPSDRVQPTLRPATPRPVVRDSLNATKDPHSFAPGSNDSTTPNTGTISTTGTTAADATTRGVSSRQQLASSTAKNSTAGDAPGDDAGDSH